MKENETGFKKKNETVKGENSMTSIREVAQMAEFLRLPFPE